MKSGSSHKTLLSFIESLQSKGKYTFTHNQAIKTLKITSNAFQKSSKRLMDKQKLFSPRNGFFVIVPTEYKSKGIPPTSWFVHDLMQFMDKQYYVGLLSAATLHGAAHQQPQMFQIVTSSTLKPVKKRRCSIHFYSKRHFSKSLTQQIKTATGYMTVSTPETTAFDLIQYAKSSGHIQHVATVLEELSEKLSKRKLVQIAKLGISLSVVQRLGYLLDFLGKPELTDPLFEWLSMQNPLPIRLRPERPSNKETFLDEKWRVLVNEIIEVDEL